MVTRGIEQLLQEARSQIARLTPEATAQALADGALLVDIRPERQRAQHGQVPGALIIERNVLEWRVDPSSAWRLPQFSSHQLQVLILCQQGYASSFAAASLVALGYRSAGDVIGGFDAWRSAGLPTEGAPNDVSDDVAIR